MPHKIIRCIYEGCDGKHIARGLCWKHYERHRKTGTLNLFPRNRNQGEGGRVITRQGYAKVYAPDHPLATAKDKYILEHRKVVYDAGLAVPRGYVVHHVNGNKLDNRLENLEVLTYAEHAQHHADIRSARERER